MHIIDLLVAISAILTAWAYCMAWDTRTEAPEEIVFPAYYEPLFSQEVLDELEAEKWQE